MTVAAPVHRRRVGSLEVLLIGLIALAVSAGADGNIGLAGDPLRTLRRCREMLPVGGYGLVEFDAHHRGATTTLTRLEADDHAGPWFPWATVGLDHAEELAERTGLRLNDVQVIWRPRAGEHGVPTKHPLLNTVFTVTATHHACLPRLLPGCDTA